MPGCVLRVGSATKRVETLVEASGLGPIIVVRKGQPRVPGAPTLSRWSGFNVDVSRKQGNIEAQAKDAIRFLKRHEVARNQKPDRSFGKT